jgi:gliding motility-associated-like protein
MSSQKQHIDELLKEQMQHFSPNAPDVWSGVSKGLGQAAKASMAAKTSMSVTAKWAAGIVTIAIVGTTSYFILDPSIDIKQNPIEEAPIANDAPIIHEPVLEDAPPVQQILPNAQIQNKQNNTQELFDKQKPQNVLTDTAKKEAKQGSYYEQPQANKEQKSQISAPATSLDKVQSLPKPNYVTPIPNKENVLQNLNKQQTDETITDEVKVNIYNIFTPNGDGINDEFVIEIDDVASYYIKILNLRGDVVFETDIYGQHWNGNIKNTSTPCEAGLYAYVLKFKTIEGIEKVINGKVQMLR